MTKRFDYSLKLALALTLLTLPACYMLSSSKTFYGMKTEGQKVLFVVDISGSMEGKDEGNLTDRVVAQATQTGGQAVGGAIGGSVGSFIGSQTASEATKLGGAKRELIPALQGLPESASFSIITFGNDTKEWYRGMVPATGSNRNLAVAFVKSLEANGGTPASQALAKAFEQKDASLIFFVSDGQPTDGSPDQILGQVGSLNASHQVKISTVGLGDDQDAQFLDKLAIQNGGQYMKK
jgi:von Willebrand factor type A domain